MADQTVALDLRLTAEDAVGAPVAVRLGDLQKADPSAGPGALDASVLEVQASVDALRAQLATPIPVSLGSPVTLGAAVDVSDRGARQLGHVSVDNFPAFPTLQAVSGTIDVGNLPATQAISAAALPLPTGAATAARQDAQETTLATLAGIDYATEGTLQTVSGKLGTPSSDDMLSLLRSIAANTLLETTKTDVLQLTADQVNLNTDQVEAKLDTVSARIGTTAVPGSAVERIEAVRAAIVGTPAVSVSNWPATQPVSAAALPLPAGASTAARQDAASALLGAGLPAALVGGRLDVSVGAMPSLPAGANAIGSVSVSAGPFLTDTQLRASALPLPTGASTETTLAAINTKLGNPLAVTQSGAWPVDTELPAAAALGDNLSRTQSVPVVGAAALVDDGTQLTRLRSYTAINGTANTAGLLPITPLIWTGGAFNGLQGATGDSGISALFQTNIPYLLNSAGQVDRQRGNVEGTALASAARTTTTSSADITNHNGDGVLVVLRVSVVPGTAPSLTLAVEGKDPVSGVYYALNATPTAVTAVGTYVYEVAGGASGAAGGGVTQRTAGKVPRIFRVTVTAGNANSATYSVGYSILTA